MSYIIQRKVKKATYVYECRSYRNKQGKPRNKQKYLGRLDSDGVLITKRRRLPAKIREVKTVIKRFILEPVSEPQREDFLRTELGDFLPTAGTTCGEFLRLTGKTSLLSSRHSTLKPKSCAPKKSGTFRPVHRLLKPGRSLIADSLSA
ncbi:MAG: hypothetical protein IJS28_10380 [Synergistaceae bacterium]|nr:hypothetical protein [Synergistaceae bacterium]